eukprot:6200464-Pleurochrysis_carterae.AAC.1
MKQLCILSCLRISGNALLMIPENSTDLPKKLRYLWRCESRKLRNLDIRKVAHAEIVDSGSDPRSLPLHTLYVVKTPRRFVYFGNTE